METYELCIEWDRVLRKYSSSGIDIRRKEIAQALQRKGEDPLLCSNPSADQIYLSEKKALFVVLFVCKNDQCIYVYAHTHIHMRCVCA